ncbi:MAG: helix-turn-helix transcriptional regulator [Deltaproteobacteria bacterium]|nr:helix-turn-helix transcriptional regulator [Nannocystaceae bacterium]
MIEATREETAPVGRLVRHWRQTRGLSQLALAERAEVSTRHLSYVETGKSAPSREMVLVLASALDVPLRERNRLLLAAGFAPVYRERELANPEQGELRRALELILSRHQPYPAMVVDRRWQVLMSNPGAARVISTFVDDPAVLAETGGNAMMLLFHPRGFRPSLVNWDEVARASIERLRREAFEDHAADGPQALLAALAAMGPLPAVRDQVPAEPRVLIPVHLRKGELELRFFTTIASLGTPIDLVAHELRIEHYYPVDDATQRWCCEL